MTMHGKKLGIVASRMGSAQLVAVILALIFLRGAQSAETPRLPEDIAKALARNASELDPLSITWTRTRSTSLSAREFLTKIQYIHDWGFLQPADEVFKWQGGCAYLSNSSKRVRVGPAGKELPFAWDDTLELIVGVNERAFDGEFCYNGSGGSPDSTHTPGLLVEPLERAESQARAGCYPAFLGHAGFAFPYYGSELRTPQSSAILRLLERGGSVVRVQDTSIDGKRGVVVELTGKERSLEGNQSLSFSYRLLPEYGYAVQSSEERTLDGKLLRSVENSDFTQVPGRAVYLPKKSTVRYYTWITIPNEVTEQPLLQEVFTVNEVDTRVIDKQQFCLREMYRSPGTGIADYRLGEGADGSGIQYTIPANPEDLDRVIEQAMEGESYVPTRRNRFVLLLAVAAPALALLGFLVWQRKRKA